MPNPLDYYGYKNEPVGIVSEKAQEEEKQSGVDNAQNINIQKNYDENVKQQGEIDRNTQVNDLQAQQIDEINEKIKHITSGGTIDDYDMGDW